MKKPILLAMFILCWAYTEGQTRAVKDPQHGFRASPLFRVESIELSDEVTMILMNVKAAGNWREIFMPQSFIEDVSTGKRYYLLFGRPIHNVFRNPPLSPDSSYVLKYPPLSPEVEKINIGFNDRIFIYDVDVNPVTGGPKASNRAVAERMAMEWMWEETEKVKRPPLSNLDSPDFFNGEPGRLIGYINGYDPRAGFATGMIYAHNILTNEDYPVVVNIHQDGRFEAEIPLQHPARGEAFFSGLKLPFYIEPGQTVAATFNWEDYLTALCGTLYSPIPGVKYIGPLSRENTDLYRYEPGRLDWAELNTLGEKLSASEFEEQMRSLMEKNIAEIDKITAGENKDQIPYSRKSAEILRMLEYLEYGYNIMDRLSSFKDNNDNKPGLSPENYRFLKTFPINDPKFLVSDPYYFINRFEFCDILRQEGPGYRPEKKMEQVFGKTAFRDSLIYQVLGLEPSLIYDITKLRSLKPDLSNMTKDEADIVYERIVSGFGHPFLSEQAETVYNLVSGKEGMTAYELPDTYAADIFRKFAKPLNGKYVIVDFWATSCGPCLSGIRKSKGDRIKLTGSPDIEFLFITNEALSPQKAYDDFVAGQKLVNTYRISQDDYNRMRELFRFNGIPRYVLLDRRGRVLNDDFYWRDLKTEIEKLLEQEQQYYSQNN